MLPYRNLENAPNYSQNRAGYELVVTQILAKLNADIFVSADEPVISEVGSQVASELLAKSTETGYSDVLVFY